ncbi:hypothetical protein, partial [Aeromonas hydrophila]|uniref:hypothetical protein n=1 Tax=Aeromonas hydrophila TaxID=644 RepID=UPI002B4A6C71
CCLAALLPCCLAALLPCCLAALLPCCLAALLPCCLAALLPCWLTDKAATGICRFTRHYMALRTKSSLVNLICHQTRALYHFIRPYSHARGCKLRHASEEGAGDGGGKQRVIEDFADQIRVCADQGWKINIFIRYIAPFP